ncbi:hypothetical protein HBH56_118620 [Parastagonospora nodorum]|uniref:Uncharacterized protein n=1 Tax=Phaeosphaeria nodorum (strain SN15 / ATCC MYA-4574 / FGSC 10173) TaxID=321614 RepID=A0A7U2I8Q1_PHANO|nr:hypothetical protein HBH56_118620 [Parastagonospora nodorum]QRD05305.1 hypothetical protein JI435_422230 [Parastagonospora nodorum SN15]KAH3928907.1 hypothetical protein HBH54_130570 [Parastagonospora nodorum]KAH3959808.1 hypothetical protein HBH51_197030 [Parastagonospora nodorum]KAH3974021.1 hypothetical protein HBH52_140960 [Parastagonospora nodorum]
MKRMPLFLFDLRQAWIWREAIGGLRRFQKERVEIYSASEVGELGGGDEDS